MSVVVDPHGLRFVAPGAVPWSARAFTRNPVLPRKANQPRLHRATCTFLSIGPGAKLPADAFGGCRRDLPCFVRSELPTVNIVAKRSASGEPEEIAPGRWRLNPLAPFAITIDGGDAKIIASLKRALEKSLDGARDSLDRGFFLFSKHRLRCLEVEAWVDDVRAEFLAGIARRKEPRPSTAPSRSGPKRPSVGVNDWKGRSSKRRIRSCASGLHATTQPCSPPTVITIAAWPSLN
jgi:hypothetical protein